MCSSVEQIIKVLKRLDANKTQKLVLDGAVQSWIQYYINTVWQVAPELGYSLNFHIFSLHVVPLGIPQGNSQLNHTNPEYFRRIVV